jgi:hypothetical protein
MFEAVVERADRESSRMQNNAQRCRFECREKYKMRCRKESGWSSRWLYGGGVMNELKGGRGLGSEIEFRDIAPRKLKG